MTVVREYAIATPESLGGVTGYERFCDAAAASSRPDGWGLLLCEDDGGRRSTMASDDVAWVELLELARTRGIHDGFDLPAGKIVWRRDGWPDAWPVS